MSSYQTVQVVAFSGTPIANQDYIALAPGYTISGGSLAVAAGASSGTSMTRTSNLSFQVGSSNVTFDLSTTGVTAASSYNSLTVDAFGRVTAAQVVATSSGTSLTPVASETSFTVGSSNVTIGLAYIVTAGSGCSVTYDKMGRVTAAATSITTAAVTGTWTSAVSSADVQGLGSTWTVSRLSSALSILGNEVWASGFSGSVGTFSRVSSSVTVQAAAVWASGFSGLGSIATLSRVSSNVSILAAEVWSSGFSALGSIVTASWVSSARTSMAVELWSSGVSAKASIGSFSYTSSSRTAMASEVWSSGFSALGSIATLSRVSSNLTVYAVDLWGSALSLSGQARIAGVSYTWPSASAAGFLQDNGSGTLAWAVPGTAVGVTSVKTLSADTGRVALAIAHVDDLGFALAASAWYKMDACLIYQSQAATTGLRVKVLSSTNATNWAGAWDITGGLDAANGVWHSIDTDANNSVESATPTAAPAADQNALARASYMILTGGAASNASVAFGTEINNSRVTLVAGSAVFLTRLS